MTAKQREQVMRGLVACGSGEFCLDTDCPYRVNLGDEKCSTLLARDALALIDELHAEIGNRKRGKEK